MAFFDLKTMRSYKCGGWSGMRYYFYKGTPTEVSEADVEKFRNQPEIFIEVEKNGTPIVAEVAKKARTVRKFRDFGDDPEDILQNAFNATVAERQKGVDVKSLLEEVNSDLVKDDGAPEDDENDEDEDELPHEPVSESQNENKDQKDGTITSDKIAKRPTPKKKSSQ